MRSIESCGLVCLLGGIALTSVGVAGCSSSSSANPVDAGHADGASADGGVAGGGDATSPSDAGDATTPEASTGVDAAGLPQKVLVTYGPVPPTNNSELLVVDVAGKTIDGTLNFGGSFGVPFSQPSAPFLLEQAVSVVARLDELSPQTVDSTWNVALTDAPDGSTYSDPVTAIVTAPNAAYVVRYTRNEIAVIDPTQTVDGGAPVATIDLSPLVQPKGDGIVEATAAAYVPSSKLLYVVLGNINRGLVVNGGANQLCAGTVSSLTAIDTTTNKIVSLQGTAPGGAIALKGYDPVAMAYDSVGGRLLIDHAGCNLDVDGGAGALVNSGIEAVTLSTGATQILHDGSADGFPSSFVYIDATHAILGFDFYGAETVQWDPTQTALGAGLPNAPDYFVYDGAGNLLGTLTNSTDGGTTTDVISVSIATDTATTLVSNPFASGGFVGGVDLWPHL